MGQTRVTCRVCGRFLLDAGEACQAVVRCKSCKTDNVINIISTDIKAIVEFKFVKTESPRHSKSTN